MRLFGDLQLFFTLHAVGARIDMVVLANGLIMGGLYNSVAQPSDVLRDFMQQGAKMREFVLTVQQLILFGCRLLEFLFRLAELLFKGAEFALPFLASGLGAEQAWGRVQAQLLAETETQNGGSQEFIFMRSMLVIEDMLQGD